MNKFPVIIIAALFIYSVSFAADTAESLIKDLSRAVRKSEKIEICLKIAGIYLQSSDAKNALEYYKKALAEKPVIKMSYDIWISIGDLHLLSQNYSEAIQAYKEAVPLQPSNENARLKLATAYEQSELYELSRQQYFLILARNPKSFNANYFLAMLYMKQNLNSSAMEYFKKALTIRPDVMVYRQAAFCARNLGESGLAIAMLKRVVSTEERYDDLITLGGLYQSQKMTKEAEETYSKAVKLDPSKADAYLYLGVLYLEDGQVTPAEKMLQIAQEKDPQEALAYFFLAYTDYAQKKTWAASESIKKTIELSKSKFLTLYSKKFAEYLKKSE